MVPVWRLLDHSLIPSEEKCPLWHQYMVRKTMAESGVPAYLIEKEYGDHPKDMELLSKLRVCFERGAVLGIIGKAQSRSKALVTMTRYLARQPKRKLFRVVVIDLDFRAKMQEKSVVNSLVELMEYKGCLLLLCFGGSFPEWMVLEMSECLIHRSIHRKPTVVLDESNYLLKDLRGLGEVLGCQI
jgi:hypothetical protein